MGSISITDLGKAYKQYPTRWARLLEWIVPGNKPRHIKKWVIRNINLTVSPGEAVGIIGINGAGKSTLLKMITGTTQPTTGRVDIGGRVAALLELGMGFHPDFTGRQNALMAGQLLGYSVEEMTRLMPDIESFADIGDYIDQPMRVYSSGMQMRLAFSVATAHRPDVLIVDEALSVGDTYFQHKSFDRIREFRNQGTTLLIVSHDKAAIQSICNRAVLLNAGRIAMQGEPEAVMDYYNAMLSEQESQSVRQQITADGKLQTISGTGDAGVIDVVLLDEKDERIEIFDVGALVALQIDVCAKALIPRLVVGYVIKDRLGQPIYGTNTHHLKLSVQDVLPAEVVRYKFDFKGNLGPGTYSIAVALTDSESHIGTNFEWRDLALIFNVINNSRETFVGCAWLMPHAKITRELQL